MAIPTAPTITSIVEDALREVYGHEASSDEMTLGRQWLNKAKNHIAGKKPWHPLEETQVLIPNAYEQRITDTTSFQQMLEVTFYDGTVKGTAQTGTISQITLASDETISEGSAKGKPIFYTGGTGKSQMSRIISYDISTKIAVFSPSVTIAADSSTTYMIADYQHQLTFIEDQAINPIAANAYPTMFSHYNNEFYLDSIPDDSTYAIILKFLVSINNVDLDSTRHANILSSWENALWNGVYWRGLRKLDDSAWKDAFALYNESVRELMIRDKRSLNPRDSKITRQIGGMPR